jgi:hypothetical protein
MENIIAKPSPCDAEPPWWRELAEKARVQTHFLGLENWKVTLSRLVNDGFAEMQLQDGKYVVALSVRGKLILERGEA